MNLYFDTEFTGLVPGTRLISIGIVNERGEKYYGEFDDYDSALSRSGSENWIRENVIANLATRKVRNSYEYSALHEELMNDDNTEYYYGDTAYIKKTLLIWIKWHTHELSGKKPQRVQFISDVCHYDFYLLQNQVFGGAFEMPEFINPICYDISWDIYKNECLGIGNNYNCTRNMNDAFDISREELLRQHAMEIPSGQKHNALYDAEVIKSLYEYYYNCYYRFEYDHIKEEVKRGRKTRRYFDTWFEDPEYVAMFDS